LADYLVVSPGQAQAVAVAAILLLAACGVVVVFVRRRRGRAADRASAVSVAPRDGSIAARRSVPEAFVTATLGHSRQSRAATLVRRRPAIEARLEAAARLVDASGMVLWALEPMGRCLAVHAAVGYPPSFLESTGTIALDAPVLTAAAYGERRVRTRKRRGWHLAAIAAPVEHDGRVLGVLTAEMSPETDGTVSPEAEALVRLLALQLAPGLAAERWPSQHDVTEEPDSKSSAVPTPPSTAWDVAWRSEGRLPRGEPTPRAVVRGRAAGGGN